MTPFITDITQVIYKIIIIILCIHYCIPVLCEKYLEIYFIIACPINYMF
jgi:hypothetical protein